VAFWQLRPAGALAAHVEMLWASRREALPHGLEWLLPSGCADLVIPLHDDAVLRVPQGRVERLLAEAGPPGRLRRLEALPSSSASAQTGLTPKRLARVLRFNRALVSLAGPHPPSLAELALTTGHADQAHFAHEFRRFAGVPASCYRPASPDQPRHLPERSFLQDTLPRPA
jgi:Helix-turn-helix domain